MPPRAAAAALLLACLALFGPPACQGALNVGTHAPDDLLRTLRQSIFVETAYLAERREERCSSLDGPRCLAALLGGGGFGPPLSGGGGLLASGVLDGPGVLPETLLQDLGVPGSHDLAFVTPEYSVLDMYRQQHEAFASNQALPLLTGPEASAMLGQARSAAEAGILHFQGLQPDARLPLSFSRGLPGGVVATWDGRWLVRDCNTASPAGASSAPLLALPAPGLEEDPSEGGSSPSAAPATTTTPPGGLAAAGGLAAEDGHREVSVTVELAGSVGYIRFSKPVIVRSLFARWQSARHDSQAIVGGRLGLEAVWVTHLDPVRLRESSQGAWLDIGSGTLRPVDEIAFVGVFGLELGAMEVVASSGDDDDEPRSVLLLAPLADREEGRSEGFEEDMAAGDVDLARLEESIADPKPQFSLRMEKLAASAAPYIMSLQEVIDRNLRLHGELQPRLVGLQPPGAFVPGLLTAQSPRMKVDETNATWAAEVVANQAMFEHSALGSMMLAHVASAVATDGPIHGGHGEVVYSAMQALTDALGTQSPSLPADLKRDLPREKEAILEALYSWLQAGGGWQRRTPLALPYSGSEEALARYAEAKRRQTKFDLLTAAYLHATLVQRREAAASKKEPGASVRGGRGSAAASPTMRRSGRLTQK